jgi:peptidoglycan/xylan/chitin deacetylase (PgdA/CDA1 family)
MTVGLHSHRHLPLAAVPAAEMRRDLRENSLRLRELIGKTPRWISYPYGGPDAWSASVLHTARTMALTCGFTMTRQVNQLPLSRLTIGRLDTNDAPGGKSPLGMESLACA